MINDMIKEGKIVPSEVTVRLLLKAMEDSKGDKFLIDGFPRTDENRAVFERMVPFLLYFTVNREHFPNFGGSVLLPVSYDRLFASHLSSSMIRD